MIYIMKRPVNTTRLSLPQTILEYFGEQPKGNSPAIIQQVIKFLYDNESRILLLDEVDYFIKADCPLISHEIRGQSGKQEGDK